MSNFTATPIPPSTVIAFFLAYLERKGSDASNPEFTKLVNAQFPNRKWSRNYWDRYRAKIRKGHYDHRLSPELKALVNAVKTPPVKRFPRLVPKNRLDEVERQVAECLASVTYFISPKVADAIAKLNMDWQKQLGTAFPEAFDMDACFYSGSASVFGPVRRKENQQERAVASQRFHPKFRAVLDLNWFPREAIAFLCDGVRYGAKMWKKSGLGTFELAHILPHKSAESSFAAKCCTSAPTGTYPHGLFTCVANVALIPKGLAKPTDVGGTIRLAFLNQYFAIYGEHHSAGFRGFSVPAEYAWVKALKWQPDCVIEPPDWAERVQRLDEFRRSRMAALLSGKRFRAQSDDGEEDDEETDS